MWRAAGRPEFEDNFKRRKSNDDAAAEEEEMALMAFVSSESRTYFPETWLWLDRTVGYICTLYLA